MMKFLTKICWLDMEDSNAEVSNDETTLEISNLPTAKKSSNSLKQKGSFSKTGVKRPNQQQRSAVEQISAYKKKIVKVSNKTQGSLGQFVVQKAIEFDFDSIGPEEISDTPRQIIVKKKHFPKDMISIITKAEYILISNKMLKNIVKSEKSLFVMFISSAI